MKNQLQQNRILYIKATATVCFFVVGWSILFDGALFVIEGSLAPILVFIVYALYPLGVIAIIAAYKKGFAALRTKPPLPPRVHAFGLLIAFVIATAISEVTLLIYEQVFSPRKEFISGDETGSYWPVLAVIGLVIVTIYVLALRKAKKEQNRPEPSMQVSNKHPAAHTVLKRTGLAISVVFGLIVGLILLVVIFSWIQQIVRTNSQNKKFAAAQSRCETEPVVVIKTVSSFIGESTGYGIYSPLHPDYKKVKNVVASPINQFEERTVEGYYCSLEEAQKSRGAEIEAGRLIGGGGNYTEADRQKARDAYLSEHEARGVKFYAPKESLKGFKTNAKQIDPSVPRYNIGYIGDTPATKGKGEKEPINLICQPSEDVRYGNKVATNRYGGDIYLEEDQYNLNIRSYLNTTVCTLETKVSQDLNHADGIALVSSVEEVNSSIVARYDLDL